MVLTINQIIRLKLHLPNGCNDFAESDVNETEDGENKINNFDDKLQNHEQFSENTEKKNPRKTYDEEFADNTGQYIKCATNDDIGLDDQLQVLEEILEESNDFPKEGDDETVINVFGTTFNFYSSL